MSVCNLCQCATYVSVQPMSGCNLCQGATYVSVQPMSVCNLCQGVTYFRVQLQISSCAMLVSGSVEVSRVSICLQVKISEAMTPAARQKLAATGGQVPQKVRSS
jgi:hypothetical protein